MIEPIDFTPFSRLAAQLYDAAWVAERTVAVGALLHDDPDSLEPVVREIIARGNEFSACDAWRAGIPCAIHLSLQNVDALVVPTSPTIRTLAEMARELVRRRSAGGHHTYRPRLARSGAGGIRPALPTSTSADTRGDRARITHARRRPSPDRCASRWWARISAACRSMFS